ELIKFLKDDKLRDDVREQAIKYARETFSWPKVADRWIEEFNNASKTMSEEIKTEEVVAQEEVVEAPVEATQEGETTA
ncbi:glycosyltransferase, partial [Klebsiella pneumoniae]|uniref:glycosyltransferase n=1 Tax=Klebsiella pneumoniae TaxID=573 RepID=UPI002730CC62